jgi:hypothetical protein
MARDERRALRARDRLPLGRVAPDRAWQFRKEERPATRPEPPDARPAGTGCVHRSRSVLK